MRKRTAYPTTPSSPSSPANTSSPANPRPTGSWVYSVTEKGLLTCGASTLRETAAQLRQLADTLESQANRLDPPPKNRRKKSTKKGAQTNPVRTRRGTVCGRYRHHSEHRVPDLRLCGLWLGGAGFDLGQKYEVHIETGQLLIRAL